MRYIYITSLFKREEIFKEVNLNLCFNRRIEQIINIVDEHSKPCNMSERSIEILIIESVLYSYDKINEKSPIEDMIELSNTIKSARHKIQVENSKKYKKWFCCF
jgi:hypothetical protein